MITIEEFKTYFKRDFNCLPVWSAELFYNTGEVVYYEPTRLFYAALKDGVSSLPTVTADWSKVEGDIYDYISDEDIEKALDSTSVMLPVSRFEEKALKIAQYLLTAHCLVVDIRVSNSGLASQFPFPLQSKSVGSISESYGIPSKLLQREIYAFYITSGYGLRYLALLLPRIRGNVGIAYGATTP